MVYLRIRVISPSLKEKPKKPREAQKSTAKPTAKNSQPKFSGQDSPKSGKKNTP
jgi:hypothetical protein